MSCLFPEDMAIRTHTLPPPPPAIVDAGAFLHDDEYRTLVRPFEIQATFQLTRQRNGLVSRLLQMGK